MLPRQALTPALDASYRFCGALARREARNFYYSFLLLPPHRRRSMCALYAFMRQTDDLADDPAPGRDGDAGPRCSGGATSTARSTAAKTAPGRDSPRWPTRSRGTRSPGATSHEVIDGVAMDLHPQPFATFDDLYGYCYHVASAVGLCCLHIWGYRSKDGQAESLAEACGIALQLTNILRDVREDARERPDLPAPGRPRTGSASTRDELDRRRTNDRVRALLAFEGQPRLRPITTRPGRLPSSSTPVGRPVLATIVGIYRALLDEIARRDYDVLAGASRAPLLAQGCDHPPLAPGPVPRSRGRSRTPSSRGAESSRPSR